MGNCCCCFRRSSYQTIESSSGGNRFVEPPLQSIEISSTKNSSGKNSSTKNSSTKSSFPKQSGQAYSWELELYIQTQSPKRIQQVRRHIEDTSLTYFFKLLGIMVSEVTSTSTDENYIRFKGTGNFITSNLPVYQIDYDQEVRMMENEQLQDSLHPSNNDIDWAIRLKPLETYTTYDVTLIYAEAIYKAFKQSYRFKIKKYNIDSNNELTPLVPYFYWYGKGCVV